MEMPKRVQGKFMKDYTNKVPKDNKIFPKAYRKNQVSRNMVPNQKSQLSREKTVRNQQYKVSNAILTQ